MNDLIAALAAGVMIAVAVWYGGMSIWMGLAALVILVVVRAYVMKRIA